MSSKLLQTVAQGDKRSKVVRERSRSSAAFASSTASSLSASILAERDLYNDQSHVDPKMYQQQQKQCQQSTMKSQIHPALFTSICYKGLEVIFTAYTQHIPTHSCLELVAIHARTRVPFQTLTVESSSSKNENNNNKNNNNNNNNNNATNNNEKQEQSVAIVALASHPTNGYVYAATSSGTIYSFYPTKANYKIDAFGKYRWVQGCVANIRQVFGYNRHETVTCFHLPHGRRNKYNSAVATSAIHKYNNNQGLSASTSGVSGSPPLPTKVAANDVEQDVSCDHCVMIRASQSDKRVLIAHRDQLCIYDFSLSTNTSSNNMPHYTAKSHPITPPEAVLLWTHKMEEVTIEHCSISGDGCAIALVLRGEGVGVPYPFGVRTFIRDGEDGSGIAHTSFGRGETNDSCDDRPNGRSVNGNQSKVEAGGRKSPVGTIENPPLPRTSPLRKKSAAYENDSGDGINDALYSIQTKSQQTKSSNGILYKTGPFLIHSAPVTRLSFRNFGTMTSSSSHNSGKSFIEGDDEGNDLLLTTCNSDSSVRIFNQNSWKQLMHWNSPPKSRADWVRGISMANLGDLDSCPTNRTSLPNKTESDNHAGKKQSPNPKDSLIESADADFSSASRSPYKRQSSSSSSISTDAGARINHTLLGENLPPMPNPLAVPSHSEPGTHAGAWIAELTFHNAFPALRLSRLSYMKSGEDDALPAHFESVAAILPAGSLAEEIVLSEYDEGESRMEVEGIWPIWDPWESEIKGNSGGRSSSDPSQDGGANERVVSGHAAGIGSALDYKVSGATGIHSSSMGGARWFSDGADLGGSHVPPSELRITSSHPRRDCITQIEMPLWCDKDFGAMEFGSPLRYVMAIPGLFDSMCSEELPKASLEFEVGSRLCATASSDRRSIDLCWRKHGTVNLEEDFASFANGVQVFQDLSLTPLPLILPSLRLPGKPPKNGVNFDALFTDKNTLFSLQWWPDDNFGGPPRLVAVTKGGTILVYEMPPPWSALEPPMPSYDPFNSCESRGSSIASDYVVEQEDEPSVGSLDEENPWKEYVVSITPHADFGIGLRLEAQAQGMPPIAGSFKKHPLSGGRLPAERTGTIALGDELLCVNDVTLEGLSFEDAIATVRQIGFDSFGAPLRMRFRRLRDKRSRGSGPTSHVSRPRRGLMDITEDGSFVTVEVGADAENQQEFGRIIAVVRNAIVSDHDPSMIPSPPAMLLIPWNFGKGAIVSHKMYGGSLILWAVPGERMIKAARLEVVLDIDPENARFMEIGSIALDDQKGSEQLTIQSISLISSSAKGWLTALCDSAGNVSLLFVETFSLPSSDLGNAPSVKASFRYYSSILNAHGIDSILKREITNESFILRSFSVEIFGSLRKDNRPCTELTIWTASPLTASQASTSSADATYKSSTVSIAEVQELSDEDILDFRWISSGFVDAYPWLILFTRRAAILYRRSGNHLHWRLLAVLCYESNVVTDSISPCELYPHMISAFRSVVLTNDEMSCMRCDWHPESILASICTEETGAQLALKRQTYSLYSWLSQWMTADESSRPSWDAHGRFANAPFQIINNISACTEYEKENNAGETSNQLMSVLSLNPTPAKDPSEVKVLLSELLKSIDSDVCLQQKTLSVREVSGNKHKLEVSVNNPLPVPLQKLNKDELICVWAIGDVLSEIPLYNKLDSLSQRSLFSITLMRRLVAAQEKLLNSSKSKQQGTSYEAVKLAFVRETSSVDLEQIRIKFNTAASAAFLSALMSDSQTRLIDACRPKDGKFDWEAARSVGIPFWVRSNKLLISIAEEIAAAIYKSTKNVMDCALYYVAMRNMKMLRAIAATDRSDSGKKLLKFIIDHDFYSDRGRKAAEKNAYSLLRKRKYASAAFFFLLTEPPMIKAAMDIIVSQMQDVSLAFFVARLMENVEKSIDYDNETLTIGGNFQLSSMGGGGGFAESGFVNSNKEVQNDIVKFDQWTPSLGQSARSILMPQEMENSEDDNCFAALQLIWLNCRNKAMLRLAHMSTKSETDATLIHDVFVPLICQEKETSLENYSTSSYSKLLQKTNDVINFCSGPFLLKKLNPKKSIMWSSALLVSRALRRCGMEMPSMKILLGLEEVSYDEESPVKRPPLKSTSKPSSHSIKPETSTDSTSFNVPHSSNSQSSSIFDSFELPKAMKSTKQKNAQSEEIQSSIFDSFDVPPPKSKAIRHAVAEPSFSIFDSFDPPQSNYLVSKQTPAPDLSSSIFDAYDTPPPRLVQLESDNTPATTVLSSCAHISAIPPSQKPDLVPISSSKVDDISIQGEQIYIPEFVPLWDEWRRHFIHVNAARILLREMERIATSFHGEPHYSNMESFIRHNHPLIPPGAAEVLHTSCNGDWLIDSIQKSLSDVRSSFGLEEDIIIEQALELLSFNNNPRRIVLSVLLQCILGRIDFAEDVFRDAAMRQINSCEFIGLSNDPIVENMSTRYNMSSQWVRRDSLNVVWQLELCLWLNRGGTFDISPSALKEMFLAVRVGVVTANWCRCHQSLETLIKAEPDCPLNFDKGRNLWRSMKIIVENKDTLESVEKVASGGWEFLVDCGREEATEMLRDGLTGQFLIRPHSQDPGVFTLSFKTNLVPSEPIPPPKWDDSSASTTKASKEAPSAVKIIKRDDVVQHAIIRLSDSGFRCGSFGPFTTLTKLLQTVSESLPFNLRFNSPPIKGIIKETGKQSSPNSFLFKKLALHSTTDFVHVASNSMKIEEIDLCKPSSSIITSKSYSEQESLSDYENQYELKRTFGQFSQLLFLTEFRKESCAIATAQTYEPTSTHVPNAHASNSDDSMDEFDGSISEESLDVDEEENLGVASRMIRPLLNWIRAREIELVEEISPNIMGILQSPSTIPLSVSINALGDEIEVPSINSGESNIVGGDAMIRHMIQADSGVAFRTLRVGEPGNSVLVVLFGKEDAIKWLTTNMTGNDESEAVKRLKAMELMRVIEPITWNDLSLPKSYAASHPSAHSRYRFVDPWEVEALETKADETASASLGRGRYQTLTSGLIASTCEKIVRATGGLHLLGLWSTLKGGTYLTKALCSAQPSWERHAGGDLLMKGGFLMEPSPYENSIRKHLYGNSLFRRMKLPHRFLALLHIELLDLKNVTAPSGSSSLTAYAMLRLKRKGSSAPLNHKARSLDSAMTHAKKISKISGPNAPASWGSLVRFRFPLPEDVNCEGISFDLDRESLFKGPPTCLQVTVYEKKFMSDVELGGADVSLNSLSSGGQIEEWVPLRVGKDSITWFARMRISLHFELMSLDSFCDMSEEGKTDNCPSVGLKKIRNLSRLGAHEDHKVKSSISTPDLMGYFGNMRY